MLAYLQTAAHGQQYIFDFWFSVDGSSENC